MSLFPIKLKLPVQSALAGLAFFSIASADEVRHKVALVANPAEDYLSICGKEFDVEGGGYNTCAIDLDGDGLSDQMFANAATSGTGGTAATIYLARKDGQFTRIGTLGHGAIARESLKAGGVLLNCSLSGGGGSLSITTYLISHEGLKELTTIGSKWDDKTRKQFEAVFEAVFKDALKPDYKFVAARPQPKAAQGGGASPAKPVE